MGLHVQDNGMSLSDWHKLNGNNFPSTDGIDSSEEVKKLREEITELKTKIDKQDEVIDRILPEEGDVFE